MRCKKLIIFILTIIFILIVSKSNKIITIDSKAEEKYLSKENIKLYKPKKLI